MDMLNDFYTDFVCRLICGSVCLSQIKPHNSHQLLLLPIMDPAAEIRARLNARKMEKPIPKRRTDVSQLQGEQLIQYARDLQEENSTSLSKSIQMLSGATTIGAQTIQKLKGQTEQMKHVDNELDKTNQSLQSSERVIQSMSTMGNIKNMLTTPNAHVPNVVNVRELRRELLEKEHETKCKTRGSAEDCGHCQEQYLFRSRSLEEFKQRQQVEDEQLTQIGDLLSTLTEQARDINGELKVHNTMLDHVLEKVEDTDARVKTASGKVKQIN